MNKDILFYSRKAEVNKEIKNVNYNSYWIYELGEYRNQYLQCQLDTQ